MGERVAVIVVAAGSGQRFGAPDKVLAELDGTPALAVLFDTIRHLRGIDDVVVVTNDFCRDRIGELLPSPAWRVITGGARRQDSVAAGLAAVPDVEIVVVHDGARPFADAALFTETVAAVRAGADAAIAAVPHTDTLKRIEAGRVVETLDRTAYVLAQTPQTFRREVLAVALATADERGLTVTDEATLVERLGGRVVAVPSTAANLKLTNPGDQAMAEAILAARRSAGRPRLRTGIGYDVHRLVAGRRLVLGGVEIPFERGLDGHSDADVLLHAIADALLGAAALGDIGRHFPPGNPAFKDADSRALLAAVGDLLAAAGAAVVNVDATVVAEAPRLLPFVEPIRAAIAAALGVPVDDVSVKATTNEGMGFPGRGEGIAALAIATVATGR